MKFLRLLGFKRSGYLKSIANELFHASFDAVALVDKKFNIVKFNNEFKSVFMGDSKQECKKGFSLIDMFMETEHDTSISALSRVMSCVELDGVIKTTHDISLRAFDKLIRIGDLKITECENGWLFIFRNTLQFKERENKLIMDAQADKLTGLLNRKGLSERLESAIKGRDENSKFKIGVLFLDLDDFKPINDTYGHDAGDEILRHVSESMVSSMPDYATISRIGGDEFVCLIPVCESKDELFAYGGTIVAAVAKDVVVAGGSVINVKCSVGGAIYPDDIQSGEFADFTPVGAILKAADTAMYNAKNTGKNSVYIKNK